MPFRCATFTCLLLAAATAMAADRGSLAQAQAAYRKDRADCISGQSGQDRETCLKEAGAAYREARRGRLEEDSSQFENNRLVRCEQQPAEDRAACVRRMNGEGYTSGSVKGGGIYRELVVPAVPPQRN
jgi:hypothetical protein